MNDSTNQIKTIATYQFGNTVCEIRATHELTDEAVEQFNKKSTYLNLVKKKRADTGKEGTTDDTTEIGNNGRGD